MRSMSQKKIVQEYYSKRAKDYDWQKSRTWKSEQGFGTEVISYITETLANLEGKAIPEVGVGGGRVASALLEMIKPWIVGIDLSKEMLGRANAKLSPHKNAFSLILADAEHLPFAEGPFDAVACISTMHYFMFPQRSLIEFSRVLRGNGIFVYGDLTLHEKDKERFLDRLERMISKAHARYYKTSEMKVMFRECGFHVFRTKIVPYRKSYRALMEDKSRYFSVGPRSLDNFLQETTDDERKPYAADDKGLTLFFTLIVASKKGKPQ